MNYFKALHSAFLLFVFCFSFISFSIADSISFVSDRGRQEEINDIIIKDSTESLISYYYLNIDGYIDMQFRRPMKKFSNIMVSKNSSEDRSALFDKWQTKSNKALISRSFGPSKYLIGCKIEYPLPPNVHYIMGSPSTEEGTFFYVKDNSGVLNKVSFDELLSFDILPNNQVKVTWEGGESALATLITQWSYGSDLGAQAVIFGFDPKKLTIMELKLDSLKSVQMKGISQLICSENLNHKFPAAPSSWKFCPIDGKPLKNK